MDKSPITLLLLVLCTITPNTSVAKIQKDQYGRDIKDSSGTNITYSSSPNRQQKALLENNNQPNFPMTADWIWQDLGTSIGENIMDVADLDNDGENELILAANGQNFGSPRSVVVLSHDLNRVKCSFDFNTNPLDYHISQMDSDPAMELTIATLNEIIVIDGKTCNQQLNYEFVETNDGIALGDTNNDGIPDVAYSNDNTLFLSPINNMNNPIERLGFGGINIIIEPLGRLDGDDIGVYNQTHTILQGDDLSTINEIFNLSSSYFSFGDVDGDGSYEVISLKNTQPRTVIMINALTGQTVSEFEVEWPDVIRVQDVNDDGKDDLLLGNNQWGDVEVRDYLGAELFRVDNQDHGVSNLIVADLDQNGFKEVFFGSGHSSTGSDHLNKADWNSQTIVWRSVDLDGPYQLSKGLITLADGQKHIAMSVNESNSSYDVGGSILLNAANGIPQPFFQPGNTAWGNMTVVEVGKPLENANPYICHGGDYTYDEYVRCFDAFTGINVWERVYPNGYINYMQMVDIDDNEDMDLLVISTNGIVSAYQASNGFLKWQSQENLQSSIYRGFNNVALINNEIWILNRDDLLKINPSTGSTIELIENTDLTTINYKNNILYGSISGIGFGEINQTNLTMDQLIHPDVIDIKYLDVSQDGKVAYISTGTSQNYPYNIGVPDMDVTLVSIGDEFTPWYVGPLTAYDTNFIDQFTLFLSNDNGARKYNLRILNEDIFLNGFE